MKRREIGAAKQRLVGWLMAGGLTLTVISIGLIGLQILAGISQGPSREHESGPGFFGITLAGAGLGILAMVGGLAYGIYAERTQNKGPRQTEANFRVLSRLCLDKNIRHIADSDIEFADKPRFYVRGMLESGLVGEFETKLEVYFCAGEGMTGEAEIQGTWLGKFAPYIGDTQDRTGEFVQR